MATAIMDTPAQRRRTTTRDQQRSRVYAAENAAFDKSKSEGMTVEQVERFVEEVWNSRTVERMRRSIWTRAPRVHDGRGHRRAVSYGGMIAIPLWARSRWVVLHELAHELTTQEPAHGPHFVANYLTLVERFLGFEARERLGAEMRKRNVKTRP